MKYYILKAKRSDLVVATNEMIIKDTHFTAKVIKCGRNKHFKGKTRFILNGFRTIGVMDINTKL